MSNYLQRIDETVMDWFEPRLWRLEYASGLSRVDLVRADVGLLVFVWLFGVVVEGAAHGFWGVILALCCLGLVVATIDTVIRPRLLSLSFGSERAQNARRVQWAGRWRLIFVYVVMAAFDIIFAFNGHAPMALLWGALAGVPCVMFFGFALDANLMPPGFRKELEVRQMDSVARRIPT